MDGQRNTNGQFVKGHKGIGGRPPKAREAALLAIGQEIVNAQAWRAVVNKAVQDALGKTIIDGQVVDDPNSTAQGRNAARVFLRDTFIGKPTEYIATDLAASAYSELDAYSPAEREAALAVIRREIESLGGTADGGGDAGAVAGTDGAEGGA